MKKNLVHHLHFQRLFHHIPYDNNRSYFYLDTNTDTYLDTKDKIAYTLFPMFCIIPLIIILCHI